MAASDVSDTLDDALRFTGLNQVKVKHKPRLLSDNGPSYIASDLADYLDDKGMDHTRGRPYHPQTQGKIERWHRSLKNQILLENYYLPGDLEAQVDAFVEMFAGLGAARIRKLFEMARKNAESYHEVRDRYLNGEFD